MSDTYQNYHPAHKRCQACAVQFKNDLLANCIKTVDQISIHGKSYHPYDFVYVNSRGSPSAVLDIAQIIDLFWPSKPDSRLQVRLFNRYDDPKFRRDPLTDPRDYVSVVDFAADVLINTRHRESFL